MNLTITILKGLKARVMQDYNHWTSNLDSVEYKEYRRGKSEEAVEIGREIDSLIKELEKISNPSTDENEEEGY